jgi:ADP-heptose:LPS heptosyltransferase
MPLEIIAKRKFVDFFLRISGVAAWIFEGATRRFYRIDGGGRILILRTAALGDFILSVPALRLLRAAFPKAKLTLLTTASTEQKTAQTVRRYAGEQSGWLELLPDNLIDEIVVFSGRLSLRQISDLRSSLQEKDFGACFILSEGFSVGGIIKKIVFLRACGIRSQIFGIRTNAYPKLFPLAQIGVRRLEHHVLALIRSIEECPSVAREDAPPIRFDLSIPADAHSWALGLLTELGCAGKEIVVVAPGSRLEFKKWPEASFGALITALLKRPQTHILFVGTGQDLETVAKVRSTCPDLMDSPRVYDLSGKTQIPQLAALLARASVFIGNDGGTCHLAAAVGCRTVSISNGGEIPNSVEPWGNQRFTARFNPPCAPCYRLTFCPEGHRQCVVSITVDTVLRLVETALSEKSSSTHPLSSISCAGVDVMTH